MANGCDFIAPELDADRIGRTETKKIDDAASWCVFADRFDQRGLFEAHRFQSIDQLLRSKRFANSECQPQIGDGARDIGALLQCANGCNEDVNTAGKQRFQRFDTQTAYFEMMLGSFVRQSFAL